MLARTATSSVGHIASRRYRLDPEYFVATQRMWAPPRILRSHWLRGAKSKTAYRGFGIRNPQKEFLTVSRVRDTAKECKLVIAKDGRDAISLLDGSRVDVHIRLLAIIVPYRVWRS